MLESHSLPILTRIFLHKLEIALEEARETQYWIDTLIESVLVEKKLSLIFYYRNPKK